MIPEWILFLVLGGIFAGTVIALIVLVCTGNKEDFTIQVNLNIPSPAPEIQMKNPHAPVFISYKSEERAAADSVRQYLTRNGIVCWMAPDSIAPGSDYTNDIPVAIDRAPVVILMLSARAQTSKWIYREMEYATSAEKIIIPFVIENCKLTPRFRFLTSTSQRLDAYKNYPSACKEMLDEIISNL